MHKIVKNGLLFLNYFMANDFFDDGICGGGSMWCHLYNEPIILHYYNIFLHAGWFCKFFGKKYENQFLDYIFCWEVWYLWISNWWDRCMRSCRKILIPSLSLEGYLTKSSILWKMQVFGGEMIDPWIWKLHPVAQKRIIQTTTYICISNTNLWSTASKTLFVRIILLTWLGVKID